MACSPEHDTGIFRSHTSGQRCDVCNEWVLDVVNVEGETTLLQICPACAHLAGEIAAEIESEG